MYISFIRLSGTNSDDDQTAVHSFYKDTFSALYGIPRDRIDEVKKTRESWLMPAMRDTLLSAQLKYEPKYFFDVRTTEEFSSPAPEYLLLHGLGLKRTSPLSIKGMDSLALIQAFRLAELYMSDDDVSLFCAAEQYNKYDVNRQTNGYAVAFLVTKTQGDMLIELSGFCKSKEDMDKLLKNDTFDAIYTDIDPNLLSGTLPVVSVSPFLTQAFAYAEELYKNGFPFRVICISQYRNIYGYYIIRKG